MNNEQNLFYAALDLVYKRSLNLIQILMIKVQI